MTKQEEKEAALWMKVAKTLGNLAAAHLVAAEQLEAAARRAMVRMALAARAVPMETLLAGQRQLESLAVDSRQALGVVVGKGAWMLVEPVSRVNVEACIRAVEQWVVGIMAEEDTPELNCWGFGTEARGQSGAESPTARVAMARRHRPAMHQIW